MKNSRLTIDDKMLGDEPTWEGKVTVENIDITQALNWYQYSSNIKDAQKWFVEWAKTQGCTKQELKNVSQFNILDYDLSLTGKTLGFICRMLMRGIPHIPESTEKKLQNMLAVAKAYKSTTDKETEEVKNVPNIQERIHAQVMSYVGELDHTFDEYVDSVLYKKEFSFDTYKWLKENEIKPLIAKKIGEEIKDELLPDYNELLSSDCSSDLKEGYSLFKKTHIKKIHNYINKMIEDCEKWAEVNTKTRKPRKKKPVSADKVIAKLKYKSQDDTYKIGSVDPKKILGAQQLWVFNTKTRKLGVYHSSEPEGFTIKGTTLQNFDSKKSIQKTLRKPDVYLDKVLKSGKIVLKKLMDEITATDSSLTGRLNEETILLRVI